MTLTQREALRYLRGYYHRLEGGTPIERLRRVGELARETGLTVRALHHYDDIGLLSPSRRSEAGYRLYAEGEVARLQQIRSLRQLGFPLEEIRDLLNGHALSPLRIVEMHAKQVKAQIALQETLLERLEGLAAQLATRRSLRADDLVRAIEVMTMTEPIHRYYTEEQLETLARRREELGDEHIHEVEAEWPKLIAEMRAEYERGTDSADPHVQALARRWQTLVEEFTGGDPGIAESLRRMYQNEPQVRERSGADPELMAYVQSAISAGSADPG